MLLLAVCMLYVSYMLYAVCYMLLLLAMYLLLYTHAIYFMLYTVAAILCSILYAHAMYAQYTHAHFFAPKQLVISTVI